jgi:hypothetical protein
MDDQVAGDKSHSLQRAKRIFLVNGALFVCLVTIAAFLYLNGDEENAGRDAAPAVPAVPERAWSLSELAFLKGEMQALSEHPATMPEFEKAWVRAVCRKMILRDADFADVLEDGVESLVDAYSRGYAERFDEYFDDRAARELGFSYGLKFDPTIHGVFARRTDALLANNRGRLETHYGIRDEAEWRLFSEAFNLGYAQGYRIVEEGATAGSRRDRISLFED